MIHITSKLYVHGYKAGLPMFPRAIKAMQYGLVKNGCIAVARFTHRAIMRRVPVDTEFLKESIRTKAIRQTRSEHIMETRINAPYAMAQEFGYTHPQAIPIDYLLFHLQSPGARGIRLPKEDVQGWVYPTKFTPFVEPSIKALMRNLPKIQDRLWYKELKKQGFVSKTIIIK